VKRVARTFLIVSLLVTTTSVPCLAPDIQAGSETTLLLDRSAKAPKKFARLIDGFRKNLPEGHKVKVVLAKFHDMSAGMRELVLSMTPLDAGGKIDGEEFHFAPLRSRNPVRTVTYRKGVREGEERFYESGYGRKRYVRKIVPWKGGKMHGVVKTFYGPGRLVAESPYVEGELEGMGKSYDYKGFLLRSVPYKKGKPHGMKTEYWPGTKKIKNRIPYEKGKVHGLVRQYHENGKRKGEIPAWEGKFHGIERRYDEDGELRRTYYWILDDKVSKAEFDRRYRAVPVATTRKSPTTRPAEAPTSQPADSGR